MCQLSRCIGEAPFFVAYSRLFCMLIPRCSRLVLVSVPAPVTSQIDRSPAASRSGNQSGSFGNDRHDCSGPFSSQRVKPSVLTLAPTRNRSMEKGDNPHCSLMIWSAKASGSGRVQLLSERQGAGLSPVLTPPPPSLQPRRHSWLHGCRQAQFPTLAGGS